MLTARALFEQPDNASVLQLLELQCVEDVQYFEANADGHPIDEGGQVFFHRYGRMIPATARCCLQTYNLMAHEHTARIFALHYGRFTFALRADFSQPATPTCSQGTLRSITLDGEVDFTVLVPPWVLVESSNDEAMQAAFFAAYELAGV